MKSMLKILLSVSIGVMVSNTVCADESFVVSKVIKAGSHTAAENELHKQSCAQLGAIDVTDLSDIKLAANTTDAVICMSANPIDMTALGGNLTNLRASNLTATAPTATVNFAPYWVKGTASYANARVGSAIFIGVGVPADNCGLAGTAAINVSSGVSYITATCSYPSSRGPRQSYTEATLEGLYSKSYGTITIQ